eukprot:1159438-Pelagomonas_calceolata.AAC.3
MQARRQRPISGILLWRLADENVLGQNASAGVGTIQSGIVSANVCIPPANIQESAVEPVKLMLYGMT